MNNTLDYILDKYKVRNAASPIYLKESRWKSLTNLFNELNFTVGAEIGVERGLFSKRLCRTNPQLKLYGIDIWKTSEGYRDHVPQERLEAFYLETKERMKPFNYHIIRSLSREAVKNFADEFLDFVYIDASHDYKSVKEDITAWSKKVRSGGIVAGHDYIDESRGKTYGVIPAVNEWVEKNKIRYLFIFNQESNPSWFYVK